MELSELIVIFRRNVVSEIKRKQSELKLERIEKALDESVEFQSFRLNTKQKFGNEIPLTESEKLIHDSLDLVTKEVTILCK